MERYRKMDGKKSWKSSFLTMAVPRLHITRQRLPSQTYEILLVPEDMRDMKVLG